MAEENIFLFVPNLIGYARIILTIVCCLLMKENAYAIWLYFISAALDAVDGHAARYFNQSTRFGAMLDQLTDRIGTACLMMVLTVFYPTYSFFFQMSMAVDIAMHWLHLHTSLLRGKESHKNITDEEPKLLKLYYTNKPFLFGMCAGNEIFYISLYLLHFYDSYFWMLVVILCFPVAVGKWVMAILQGITAAKGLASIDLNERSKSK